MQWKNIDDDLKKKEYVSFAKDYGAYQLLS